MSCYTTELKNPKTGKIEKAQMLDNFFGGHHYGVYFKGDSFVYDTEDLSITKELTPEQKENFDKFV